MKNISQNWSKFILLFIGLSIGSLNIKAAPNNSVATCLKHYQTNAVDIIIFTTITKAVNDFLLQNPNKLSLLEAAGYGISSWLIGELAETIYKKIFKNVTHENLRDALGKTTIFGIEFDHQRLLRRTLTLIPILIELYIRNK